MHTYWLPTARITHSAQIYLPNDGFVTHLPAVGRCQPIGIIMSCPAPFLSSADYSPTEDTETIGTQSTNVKVTWNRLKRIMNLSGAASAFVFSSS